MKTSYRHMPSLKPEKQMKRGKHNPQACKTLSSTNQTKKMSVVLLSNCYDPRVVKGIERQVKELKVKEKVSCPIGIE